MYDSTIVGGRDSSTLYDATRFAPTVLANGSGTNGRRLCPDASGEVHPLAGYTQFKANLTAGAIYRFKDRLVLADVDSRAEYRTVQGLIAEREIETGRPAHVAWKTGGVMDDGPDRLAVAVADPDPAWRKWFIEELHRAHPRTGRWGHQYSRAPGTINVKHDHMTDGHLYELLAAGPRRITLKDARRRVRDRSAAWRRKHQAAPTSVSAPESAGIPPYETRYGARFDTRRSTAGSGAPRRTSRQDAVDATTLLRYLPPWAQAAARLDLPKGERSGPELAVCRGAFLAGLTPGDLHRILSVVPAGGRWRADLRTAATAAQRLRAAERWVADHPTRARVVAPEAREAALAAWNGVLVDAARVGLPATRWAVLLRHRVLAVDDAGGSWLGAVRDLAMGVDRSLLGAARGDLERWVVRVRAGSGGRGRDAAVWALAEPFRESAGIPHETEVRLQSSEPGRRRSLRSLSATCGHRPTATRALTRTHLTDAPRQPRTRLCSPPSRSVCRWTTCAAWSGLGSARSADGRALPPHSASSFVTVSGRRGALVRTSTSWPTGSVRPGVRRRMPRLSPMSVLWRTRSTPWLLLVMVLVSARSVSVSALVLPWLRAVP